MILLLPFYYIFENQRNILTILLASAFFITPKAFFFKECPPKTQQYLGVYVGGPCPTPRRAYV